MHIQCRFHGAGALGVQIAWIPPAPRGETSERAVDLPAPLQQVARSEGDRPILIGSERGE